MRYALPIGYPLRLCIGQEGAFQEVELQARRITLSLEQALRWGELSIWRELSEKEQPAAAELAAIGAAVTGDSTEEVMAALARCVPLRQGFCLPAEEGISVQLGKEQILLTDVQEQIWLAADGRNSLEEILGRMEIHWRDAAPEKQELLLENLLGLMTAELCYFR